MNEFAAVFADGSIRFQYSNPPADAVVVPIIDIDRITGGGDDVVEMAAAEVVRDGDGQPIEVRRTWAIRPLSPGELDWRRTQAITANNNAAGRAREAYLTAVPGQATTYAAKQAEAARWVAEGRAVAATAAAYPWAGDRAGLRGVTVAEVLAEWEAVAAAWEAVGRQIEAERERVNLAIGTAGTAAAVMAAREGATYPTP
jgi:hypothetical protein